jgi:TfoX/Sxy family transcriptional regulator of competence genes
MAFDEELANRIRELLAKERGLSELRMFGGLAFLLDGNMAVAASSKGGVMLRMDPDEVQKALAREHTRPMVMRGRPAKGWLRVDAEGVRTKRQLESWVRRGVAFARTLPPKG